MSRAAAQKSEIIAEKEVMKPKMNQARPRKVALTKAEERIVNQFSEIMRKAEERAEEYKQDPEYIESLVNIAANKIAKEESIPKDWSRFIGEVFDKATRGKRTARAGGFLTLDELVMTALSSSRPVKKVTPQEQKIIRMAFVVKRMELEPTLKKAQDRVKIAAAELGIMLDKATEKGKKPEYLDDKAWAEKMVV